MTRQKMKTLTDAALTGWQKLEPQVRQVFGSIVGVFWHSHDDHAHGHGHDHGHDHSHGGADALLTTSERGIFALKWSFIIMAGVGVIESVIVLLSGSVALFADMIHNFADATTAIPLWIAFRLARRPATKTFTYGLGRAEDLAGLMIVLLICFSTVIAGWQAVERLLHPQNLGHMWLVALTGLVSWGGNEAVARLRIAIGREINSAALVADGQHARIDALTALAVVAGAVLVLIGLPWADPLVGILITVSLASIVWQSSRTVLTRMLDGTEPHIVGEIGHAAQHVPGLRALRAARARWIGHALHVETEIEVAAGASLAEAQAIASAFRHELHEHLPGLAAAIVAFDGSSTGTAPEAEPLHFANGLAAGEIAVAGDGAARHIEVRLRRRRPGLTVALELDGAPSQPLAWQGDSGVSAATQAHSGLLHLASDGESLAIAFHL
ncbi:MAG: cation diffusion facilitator family transporter [Hyphomicrobiales bacterium]|nr:cation diffusion facilitator family transporter [Hyphomicrobiales bacterium]